MTILRRLLTFILPYRLWVFVSVMTTIAIAVIEASIGYLIKDITNSGVEGDTTSLILYSSFLLALIVAGVIVKYFIKVATTQFSALSLRDIRNKSLEHIQSLPISTIEKVKSGDILSRLTNDISLIQRFYINQFCAIIYMPAVFVCALTYMVIISWELILASLVFVPIAIILTHYLSKQMGRSTEQLQFHLGNLNSIAQDTIGGLQMIKVFNIGDYLNNKYKEAASLVLSRGLEVEKKRAFLSSLSTVLNITPLCICILYGGYLTVHGEMEPGELMSYILLINFVIMPLTVMPGIIGAMRETTAAAKRVFEILDFTSEEKKSHKNTIRGHEIERIKDGSLPVAFDHIRFSYEHQTTIVQDLCFELATGKTVAIVGPSGSGKSTLFKLLCGYYEPQEGQINLYGTDLRRWDIAEARENVSLVAQDTFLFPVSIAENIGYGKPRATMDEIIAAAKVANAHEFIMDLPEGYNTLMGERGVTCSGGQRQRIAIARAILKDSPILLLDEATSALDTQSEAVVQEAIEKWLKGKSVLVITHRLSTIKQADEIIVMDKGRIVERGCHKKLLQENGLYRRMILKSFREEESKNVS